MSGVLLSFYFALRLVKICQSFPGLFHREGWQQLSEVPRLWPCILQGLYGSIHNGADQQRPGLQQYEKQYIIMNKNNTIILQKQFVNTGKKPDLSLVRL